MNVGTTFALGDLLGEPLGNSLGRAAPVELLGDPLGDPLGCAAPLGDLVGDPLGDLGGVTGSRMWPSCAPGAVVLDDGHVTLSGMPLRGLWGSKGFGLVRTVGRGAWAAAGLLVAALAPDGPDIAPPVGVSQVESLAWRKPKPCRSVQPKYCCCLDRKSCEEG